MVSDEKECKREKEREEEMGRGRGRERRRGSLVFGNFLLYYFNKNLAFSQVIIANLILLSISISKCLSFFFMYVLSLSI